MEPLLTVLCMANAMEKLFWKLSVQIIYTIHSLRNILINVFFLSTDNGEAAIDKGHKYYTQVISQIELSQANQGYFIVWTTKDSFVQIVQKMKHFGKRYQLISIFFSKDLLQQGCWQSIHCNLVVLVKKYY